MKPKKKSVHKPRHSKKLPEDAADPIEALRFFETVKLSEEFIDKLVTILSKHAATGNHEFFGLLLRLALSSTMSISKLTQKNIVTAREVARRAPFWPTLITQSPHFVIDPPDLAKQLELGVEANTPINIKKAFRETNIARQIAACLLFSTTSLRDFAESTVMVEQLRKMFQCLADAESENVKMLRESIDANLIRQQAHTMRSYDSAIGMLSMLNSLMNSSRKLGSKEFSYFSEKAFQLPKRSKRATREWAGLGKEIILTLTDDHPENNVVLRELGAYRKDAYYRKDTTSRTFLDRKIGAKAKRTEESNIRDGIFTRILAAYRVVLNDGGAAEVQRSILSPQSRP